jgi:hypothetical protein
MSKTHIIIMYGTISHFTLYTTLCRKHILSSCMGQFLISHCTLRYVENTYYHHVWDNFSFHTVHYVMSKTHIIIMYGTISHFTLYTTLCRKHILSSCMGQFLISHCTLRYVENTYYHHVWDNISFHTVHYVMSKTHIIIMYGTISHFTLYTTLCRKHILSSCMGQYLISHCTLRYVENTYYHHVWDNISFHTVHYVMPKTHIIIMYGTISHFTLYTTLCRKHILSSCMGQYLISHCTQRYVENTYYHHVWDNFTFHTVHYVMSETHIIIMYGTISHFTLYTTLCRKHIISSCMGQYLISHCTLPYVENTYYHQVWDNVTFHTVHYVMPKTHIIIMYGTISHFTLYTSLCRKHISSCMGQYLISHCTQRYVENTYYHHVWDNFTFYTVHFVMSKTHIIMYGTISHFTLYTTLCRKHILSSCMGQYLISHCTQRYVENTYYHHAWDNISFHTVHYVMSKTHIIIMYGTISHFTLYTNFS